MKLIFKFPLINIIIIMGLTIFFTLQLPRAEIDNDVSTMIPENHPANIANRRMNDDFGATDLMLIGLTAKQGSILTVNNIKIIDELTDKFEEVKFVDDVISIANADYIEGMEDGFETYSLNDAIPENNEELADYKEKLLSWDMYEKNLYSDDLKSSSIILTLETGTRTPDHKVAYDQVQEILDDYRGKNFDFFISGYPAITVLVGSYMVKDLMFLVPIVIITVFLILIFSFKRLGGVLLPVLTVIISTIWAMGIMTLVGKKITIVSTCIPIILVAVGSAYGIHIITHYYEEIMRNGNANATLKDHDQIVFHVLKVVGKPVILAALTTCAGFSSLITSAIIPLKDFGIFSSVGVLAAVIVSLLLIPSLLIIRHKSLKRTPDEMTLKESGLTKLLLSAYHVMIKNKIALIIITILLFALSIYGILNITIDTQMVKYFKKSSIIYKADQYLNERFAGTNVLNIIIEGSEPGDLADPEVLYKMNKLADDLETKYDKIGKVVGFQDFIKRLNKVMHYPDMDAYDEIPIKPEKYGFTSKAQLKQLIIQYLLLYSGELDDYVYDDVLSPIKARMTLMLHTSGSELTEQIINDVAQFEKEQLPEGYTARVAGGADLNKAVNDLVIIGQILSLLVSLFVVFLIVTISFKSVTAGLIGIVPLTFSLLINFGIMGIFNIDLNIGTAMIASIAVGIGVDYTIHFIASYHYNRKKSDDLEVVTKETLITSGKAIIFNAASVGMGFAVLAFSNFIPLMYVGILVAIVMLTSSLGAMIFLPTLLNIFKPKFVEKG